MLLKEVLGQMEEIIRNLKTIPREQRGESHKEILSILTQIDKIEESNPAPNYKIYKQDLLTSIEILCGECDEAQEGEHLGRGLLAVRRMASYTCFNVNNHYI